MNDNVFIKTLELRSLSLQVIKRSLVILCMALFANSTNIHARAIDLPLVQDAFRHDTFNPGVAATTSSMTTDYRSLVSPSIVTNYVGTTVILLDVYEAQAALKFTLPQSSSVLSKAKLFFKVVDIAGSPTATVTLTGDNNWMQTEFLATSRFPTLSNPSVLLTDATISSDGWFSLPLPTPALGAKIVPTDATDVTLIITGKALTDNYFSFVADDDVSGDKAYLRITFKPQVQSVSVPANGTYKIGDVLSFKVSFDSLVNVTGTPKLPITLNTGGFVLASYVSGSGSQELIFRYTVNSGDLDMDGVTVGSSIVLNGGTIRSDNDDDAELNLYSVGASTGVRVNGILPAISSVSPTSGSIAGGTSVTITGVGFTDVTAVKFGSMDATSFAVNSSTQITAVSPAASTGATDITITTPNGTSTTNINDKFTYMAAPTATTIAATSITSTGATLNGSVNANNASTAVTFQYGLTTSYGTTVTAVQSPVTGSTATSVSKAITGLAAGTTYHYRVVGVNSEGTTNGGDMSFTTLVPKPAATTNAATSISSTGATLNGSINAKNGSTTVTFEYGLTTSYGAIVTADQSPVTGSAATPVSKAITGLAAGVTYHYRVVGVNAGGTTYGLDKSFTTPLFAGNGTPEDPYPIATLADLKWVSEHSDIWNGSFVQTADIDASTTSTWNAGKGFSPIGDVTTKFTGSYNGQYHTITGLTINRPDINDYNIGLFGVTSSATLKNIGLPDCSIIGKNNVGALVGYMGYNSIRTSSISDCYCTGEVSGISYVGGLVGVNQTSGITNSYSTCKVTALTDTAGLLALNINSTISNCFYDKNTSGQSDNIGKGTPKTTVEMKTQSTFTGWDFAGETANGTADIWAISSTQNNGYPCFMSQITSPVAPTVTTQAVTAIATTTATGNGDITGLGVPNPGSHGICWGTSANPTIIDNTVVNKGIVSATGAFSAPMTGLTPNTLYHVRAYATNSTGTVYGNDVSFTTQSTSQTISFGALDTKTYGDAPYNLTATSTSGLAISYSSNNTAVARVSGSTVTIVGAGTANITASQAGNTTYAAAANVIQQLTINKKALSVTAITDTKIYDGTTVSTAIPTVGTLATGDAINVAPAQVFDNANVGTTHVLTASGLTIKRVVRDNAPALDKTKFKIRIPNEDVTNNYDISYTTATGTINKKAVTVTAVADTKTYDGTTVSAAIPTVGTLATGDAINVAPTQVFDNASVGTTHVLTASGLTIKNGSADVTGNYDISYATANGTINKLGVTVTAVADTKTYDGTTVSTAIPTVGTLATGDAINGAPTQVFDNAAVGTTHVLTASGLTIKNGTTDVTGNYDISYATATGTINKLGVTVTAVTDTKTYDGTTVSTAIPTVGTLATGDAINGAPTQVFDNASVGTTHVLTASGLTIKNGSADVTGNYDISYATATGTINKLGVTVTATADTKTYDGTTVSAAIPTVGTLATGDAINVAPMQVFDIAAVGTTHVLTASGLTIKNGSADVTGNYDISYASAAGSITAKALTITIPAVTLSKVHDGNTLAAVTAGTLSGVVAGDAGKVTVAASASYDNATVGANKTITVTYTLGGSSAGNYSAPANYIATGAEIYSATIALQPLSDPTPNPTNTGLVLSYSVVTGGPTQYQITFETRAVSVGFQNVSYTALVTTGADGSISITVPKGTRPGKYKGTLKMRNDSGVESTAYDFVITVNIPTEYIAVKYNRVLVLDNSTRIFKAYQWFKNGVAIEGATKQFYRDPKGLVGTYSMQATDIDGEIIYSFPKELNIPIAQKVTAYPSLVRANQTCTVEITDESMELDLKGAELSVYSSQGIRVYHTTNVEKLNTVKLPAMDGTYSGRVTTTDGQSFLFKVIVAN